ncbi:TIGR02587 family membrane protein [Sinorhizobium meliloti]|uniref:TIGR02587 family membrane protein n=1 Tax=Rhizobium meliloti TaxID=382 RepID=UPI000FDC6E50|nr:TIGR02587 family membrane protein [Sinorhizobium meliloti]MDW9769340.1 TIGR02587 family membrane protein [Sinorhizobium meliloti]MDW9808008.1 TIGR02587 family membrane protein [Sinorhizobium meliloti]MDW9991638.1 TIGR02587 family membrane protein [Sinorhizobium meliloti]MDX0126533.1 TIGR02587 family membrane protein [Sinorhizobium meliloti]MDX0246132.1 TIGR02587 family membrane protein [Sinorhizobium meliloti]
MTPAEVVVGPTPREFWIGLGRAFAGALIFAVPVLMTMEAWALGFHLHPLRLALLLVATVPTLVLLHKYGGFRKSVGLRDRIADAFVALLVAAIAASAILFTFGIVDADMPLREIVGKVAVQIVPGSLGASLARAQLGPSPLEGDAVPEPAYAGELFLMVVGALFLSVNIAPTEEVILIAYKMNPWHEIALALGTLGLMHVFVYELEFRGTHNPEPGAGFVNIFFRYTIVGYCLVILVNFYILWTFGRTDGVGFSETLSAVVVLSFPGALGAAVARLIL